MISKARLKLIRALEAKKNRDQSGLFVAEGPRLVGELMMVMPPVYVAALPEWLEQHTDGIGDYDTLTREELERASLLRAPQEVIALFRKRDTRWEDRFASENLCLALDNVQDPGNLGTICRVADWFGIEHIVCSPDTVDVFNPKVVQATMGALARVSVHYMPLTELFARVNVPVFGTFLDGQNIYGSELSTHGFIVMGNEGNGISPEVERMVNARLLVPNFPQGRATTESLNVALATGIVCAEFRRREQ